jgi:hypothetical protein
VGSAIYAEYTGWDDLSAARLGIVLPAISSLPAEFPIDIEGKRFFNLPSILDRTGSVRETY